MQTSDAETGLETGAESAPPAARWARIRAWARRHVSAVVLVTLALGTSGAVTLFHGDDLSPIDEWVYVDYLYKLPEQGIVLKGDPIGDEALEIMACDGVTPYGPMGGECGSDYEYGDFPFGGITSADAYTPIYFVTTRVVGDGIRLVTGVDEVTGWRLTGPLWLAVSMLVLTLLFKTWRLPSAATIAIGLAFIGSPFSYWTYSYVSTDAPAFLFGTLLLYLTTRYLRGEVRGWWLIAVGVLATLIKLTNVLGVGLAALIILIHVLAETWQGRRSSDVPRAGVVARRLGTAVAMSTAAVTSQAIWLAINAATARTNLVAEQGISTQLSGQELLSQVANFLPGTITANVNIAGSTGYALPIPGYATTPLSWLCIAGVLGAFFYLRGRSETNSVVVAVVIAAATFAPLLAVALQLATNSYFSLPPRYGASILPGFLLLAGLIVKNRWVTWLLGAYGLVLCAVLIAGSALLGPYVALR